MKKINFRQYAKLVIIITLSVSVIIIVSGVLSWAFSSYREPEKPRPALKQTLDFQYMESNKKLWDNDWKSLILPNSDWDWDRIQEFWLDTEEIGVKILEEENDALITDTFELFK